MKTDRMLRVNELLLRELGVLIERDVRPYTHALVTVTAVKTSQDLQHANVYVSVMAKSEAEKAEVLRLLQDRRIEFQHELSVHIKMKYTPVLKFHLDVLSEKADRVLMIMEELHLHPETAGSGKPQTDAETAEPAAPDAGETPEAPADEHQP